MSCSGSKSTMKGSYNNANNLRQPISYAVDSKGTIWIIDFKTSNHLQRIYDELYT